MINYPDFVGTAVQSELSLYGMVVATLLFVAPLAAYANNDTCVEYCKNGGGTAEYCETYCSDT